jgi:hypothetical protein
MCAWLPTIVHHKSKINEGAPQLISNSCMLRKMVHNKASGFWFGAIRTGYVMCPEEKPIFFPHIRYRTNVENRMSRVLANECYFILQVVDL